jgi:predicted ATPase/DNA-binding winged helix-turn-helix (wHTH) protein
LLLEGEAPVRVGGRALDILIVLVQAAGEMVSHDELMARVWQRVVVDEVSVRVHVASLRRVLRDDGETRRYIVNVPGRGYSFVGEARALTLSGAVKSPSRIEPRQRQLPPLLVQVIGRDAMLGQVLAAVKEQRLVTIAGAGGIGKTTIALAAANNLAAQYRDGARFVDLAPLTDPRHVATQVALALTEAPSAIDEVELEDLLADRHLLIVLDNCEHVVQAAAAVAERILLAAPEVRLIATSREPVRAAGEVVLRLSPLALPLEAASLSAQQALAFPAIQLFVQRTASSNAAFELLDADLPIVIDICRRLDGIPLAIEMAAGRVAQLGLRVLLTRLNDRFAVLAKGRRTALPRQQTLRATTDWSYGLLTEDQQAVLRRLSVFAGTFTFDSAVAVCEDDLLVDFCDAIDELVLKSLISVDTGDDIARYRLLESTRAYALEKLKNAGEQQAAFRSHAKHVCNVFERLGADLPPDRALFDVGHGLWFDDIQLATHATFSTLGDPGLGMRLLATTASVWYERSLLNEYQMWAEMALEGAGDLEQSDVTLMRFWYSLGHCYVHTKGPHPDVARAFARTHELAKRLRNVDIERMALWGLWVERYGSGDYAAALKLARERADLTPRGTAPEAEILSRRMVQWSLHLMGEQESSLKEASVALSLASRIDGHTALDRYQLDPKAAIDSVRSRALWIQGFPDQALEVAANAVQSAESTQDALSLCVSLFGHCSALLWSGRWDDLERQAGALIDVATERRLGYWKAWGQTFRDAHAYGTEGVVTPRWRNPACGLLQLEMMATVGDELLDDDALVRAEAGKCPWSAPEVIRAYGEKLLRQGTSPEVAESLFVRSPDMARSSKALSWELRAATSLARYWTSQNRRSDGKTLLTHVLQRYTEGIDTLDVQRARKMLQD